MYMCATNNKNNNPSNFLQKIQPYFHQKSILPIINPFSWIHINYSSSSS